MNCTRKEFDAILRTDFHAFAQKSFAHLNPDARLDRAWHHQTIAYALDRVFRGECRRLIINAPPRCLKSHFGSVAFPAFVLGRRPTAKFICVSYSQDLANKHAGDFRKVVQSRWYKETFQPAAPFKETEAEFQTAQGGFRYTTSIGGTLTGRGGDIIVIDDPLNATEAYSKPARERANGFFVSSLLSRLDDKRNGAIIVIMQRLHPEDLTGFLVEQGGWDLLKLPAIAPADAEVRLSAERTRQWRAGEPLDPVREPSHTLAQVRRHIGSDFYNAQYLQEPLPERGNMLKRDWLRRYEVAPTPQAGDEIVQSWDTAIKATETSDYSVCLTFLIRNKNQYHLIDVYRDRPEFPELSKLVCTRAQQFQATAILIEDRVSGSSLIQMAKRQGLQGVIPWKPSSDKASRMMGQTPKLESGSLILPRSAPWLIDFETEYLRFPKSQHDDQMDALSQFLEWRTNLEYVVFECDFGWDDDVSRPIYPLLYGC